VTRRQGTHDTRTNMQRSTSHRAAVAAVWVGIVFIAVAGISSARAAWQAPFPSLFVDPYGSYSAVYLPSWQTDALGLRFPDRLVSVNGKTPASLPLVLSREAHRRASLVFDTSTGKRVVITEVRTLGTDTFVFFFLIYALAGLFTAWSALVVLRLAPNQTGAISYALWSTSACFFLGSFYDFHTSAKFVPLFWAGVSGTAVGCFALAATFPTTSSRVAKCLAVPAAAIVALAAVVVASPTIATRVPALRVVLGFSANSAFIVLFGVVVVRLLRRGQEGRALLTSVALGLGLVPVWIALSVSLGAVTGEGIGHLILPFVVPILPMSVGYAIVRRSVFDSGAAVPWWVAIPPAVLVAAFAATLAWLNTQGGVRLVFTMTSATTFGGLFYIAVRRAMFPHNAKLRPAYRALNLEVQRPENAEDLDGALASILVKELGVDGRLVRSIDDEAALSSEELDELLSGKEVEAKSDGTRWIPLVAAGRSWGALVVHRRKDALYSEDELEVARAVGSFAALVWQNEEAERELRELAAARDQLARQEAESRLNLLSAEVAHEVQTPLNFLNFMVRQLSSGNSLDDEDLEIATEEAARLRRMVTSLGRHRGSRIETSPVHVEEVLHRAVQLLREQRGDIAITVKTGADVRIEANADLLLQLATNLLKNALLAAENAVVVESTTTSFAVLDDGQGVDESLQGTLFEPWVTSRKGGTGIGLAVCARVARDHGWVLRHERVNGYTAFVVEHTSKASS